jgi:hypothetical protein
LDLTTINLAPGAGSNAFIISSSSLSPPSLLWFVTGRGSEPSAFGTTSISLYSRRWLSMAKPSPGGFRRDPFLLFPLPPGCCATTISPGIFLELNLDRHQLCVRFLRYIRSIRAEGVVSLNILILAMIFGKVRMEHLTKKNFRSPLSIVSASRHEDLQTQ